MFVFLYVYEFVCLFVCCLESHVFDFVFVRLLMFIFGYYNLPFTLTKHVN